MINKVLPAIRQVTNDQRQNRPSITVHPVDDQADIETAKIYQGIVRNIEQDSGADVAYDTAFEGAAIGGFGYLRVYTEYVDPRSFDQQIKIGHIDNPFSVYLIRTRKTLTALTLIGLSLSRIFPKKITKLSMARVNSGQLAAGKVLATPLLIGSKKTPAELLNTSTKNLRPLIFFSLTMEM